MQRPADEPPMQRGLERDLEAICPRGGGGDPLDSTAEVILESVRDASGALDARRIGVAPGKRDDDCLGRVRDPATITARILASRIPN